MIHITHGDCLKELSYIERDSVDFVVTDPPYFLDGLDADWKKGDKRYSDYKPSIIGSLPVGMKFDPKQGHALQTFISNVGVEMIDTMKPGAYAAVFSQPRLAHRMAVGLEDAGFEIRDVYAWRFTRQAQSKAFTMDHFVDRMDKTDTEKDSIKASFQGRKTPQLRPEFESIIIAQKPRHGTFIDNWLAYETGLIDTSASLDGKTASTVMTVEKPNKEFNTHLTVKPVAIIEHLIKIFSLPNQTILDPFLGSGTTAVAAFNTKRYCIGIEINKDYIDIAHDRVNKASGELKLFEEIT